MLCCCSDSDDDNGSFVQVTDTLTSRRSMMNVLMQRHKHSDNQPDELPMPDTTSDDGDNPMINDAIQELIDEMDESSSDDDDGVGDMTILPHRHTRTSTAPAPPSPPRQAPPDATTITTAAAPPRKNSSSALLLLAKQRNRWVNRHRNKAKQHQDALAAEAERTLHELEEIEEAADGPDDDVQLLTESNVYDSSDDEQQQQQQPVVTTDPFTYTTWQPVVVADNFSLLSDDEHPPVEWCVVGGRIRWRGCVHVDHKCGVGSLLFHPLPACIGPAGGSTINYSLPVVSKSKGLKLHKTSATVGLNIETTPAGISVTAAEELHRHVVIALDPVNWPVSHASTESEWFPAKLCVAERH